MLKFILFMMVFPWLVFATENDPFRNIEKHQLKNGLNVILSPGSATDLIEVKLKVGVGFVHENESNFGVSHLLEHVLFRNEKLKDDMSFSELIKEKEGESNGMTQQDSTSYYATIKKKDSAWLIQKFHDMIMRPSINEKYVETEKKTILLEIGEPGPINQIVGFDVMDVLSPRYFWAKSFWEEHFLIKTDRPYNLTKEQLSVMKLSKEQVQEHYKNFYDPSNMQIVVSGAFKPKEVLKQIKTLFENYPTTGNGDLRPKLKGKLQTKPFISYSFGEDKSFVSLGYKVDKVSLIDRQVLESYTDYLSHRLMKQIRNRNGETYTAYHLNEFKGDVGYFSINFSTSKEKFRENFNLVRNMIFTEMKKRKLSDSDVKEAVRLYLNSYNLWGQDAAAKGDLADRMIHFNEPHGTWVTPAEVLKNVSPEEYRKTLSRFADRKNEYINVSRPEVLFFYDYYVLCAIGFLILFYFSRKFLTKEFHNDHIRWVSKIRFPPLKLLEILSGLLIIQVCNLIFSIINIFMETSPVLSLGIYARYLEIILMTLGMVASSQMIVSYFPRKLYVMNDGLVVKSLSYYSSLIKLKDIKAVSTLSGLNIIFNLKLWPKVWRSFHLYNPRFWRPGLLIELQNGRLLFFSSKDAQKSALELNQIISQQKAQLVVAA